MVYWFLFYKIEWFLDVSAINKIDNSHVWLFMIVSHVFIFMKRITIYCSIYFGNSTICLYNKQNNTRMYAKMKLFLGLNRISHSFALLTREIYWWTLELNFLFRTCMYYSLFIFVCISFYFSYHKLESFFRT